MRFGPKYLLRFMQYVEQTPACWEWRGTRSSQNYGRFLFYEIGGTKQVESPAHRVAYELFVGPIPKGLQLDHLCRNRGCVNPKHLEAVTGKVNTLRGETLTAVNRAKTECPKGHPYDEKNTYLDPTGRRHCRPCNIDTKRRKKYWRKKTPEQREAERVYRHEYYLANKERWHK